MSEMGLGASLRTLTPKLRTGGFRYVDPYRSDDYEPDGSQQFPYKSLQDAIDAAPVVDGETIGDNLEHITSIIIGAGDFGDITVDRPICIQGETPLLTNLGDVTLSGGMLIMRNITFDDLTATDENIALLIECQGSNVTTAGFYLATIATTISKIQVTSGAVGIHRESTISTLDIPMDGSSVAVGCQNSTINTITTSAAHDEEAKFMFQNSYVENEWTMGAQDKVTNINSVLTDAVITAAGSYALITAGPVIPAEPEE